MILTLVAICAGVYLKNVYIFVFTDVSFYVHTLVSTKVLCITSAKGIYLYAHTCIQTYIYLYLWFVTVMYILRQWQWPISANCFLVTDDCCAKRVSLQAGRGDADIYRRQDRSALVLESGCFHTGPSLTSWHDFLLVTFSSGHVRCQLVLLPLVFCCYYSEDFILKCL
jgi:hypothetical protein